MTQAQMEESRKTVLFDNHVALGARIIDFGGWQMPVMYSTIVEEHVNVREQAGLFDLCHMGRLDIKGEGHKDFLHKVLTNNVHDLASGMARYSLICNNNGLVQDDILIYAKTDSETFMVVNASNREKIVAHLNAIAEGSSVTITDRSFDMGMLAIQGPRSVEIVNDHADINVDAIPYYGHQSCKLFGIDTMIARTGYTGEDGFEFFIAIDDTINLWEKLLDAGKDKALLPIGLGARDTLRLEAGMPLYGHEIDDTTTPLEAGLRFAVKLKKDPQFIGQANLIKSKEDGLKKCLVGIELKDKRVPRQGYLVKHNSKEVGMIVSGTASPTLGKNLAHAFVPPELKEVGTELHIEIRGKEFPAVVVPKPFYKRPS